jgi:phosphopantetheine adenylyltransferase
MNFPYDVFLSHSSKDKPVVREIAKLGGDVSGLVSAPVLNALQGKVATKH